MYTPGFAAPEQYRDPDRLGPWTDVYGTGASMFACLAAFAPQAADARTQEDHLVPAKKIWAGQYSDNVLSIPIVPRWGSRGASSRCSAASSAGCFPR